MGWIQDGLWTITHNSDSRWRLLCLSFVFFGSVIIDGHVVLDHAFVSITYKDPVTGDQQNDAKIIGRYGRSSNHTLVKGSVVHVRSVYNANHGCDTIDNVPNAGEPWVALIERGHCRFTQKITNAVSRNASAVVVYNDEEGGKIITMDHHAYQQTVAIFISLEDGQRIAGLVDNGTRVHMTISDRQHVNKTDVPFVSTPIIFLIVIAIVIVAMASAFLVYRSLGKCNNFLASNFKHKRFRDEINEVNT